MRLRTGPMTSAELAEWFDAMAAGLVLYARQWARPDAAGSGAEDAVQDAFVKLASQEKTPANVRAWLLLTVKHLALDAAKVSRRRAARDRQAGEARVRMFEDLRAYGAGAAGADPLDASEAQRALEQLPAQEREAITLRLWNGATFEEIAAVMGLPLSTVYHNYRSGLATLRARWELPCPKK